MTNPDSLEITRRIENAQTVAQHMQWRDRYVGLWPEINYILRTLSPAGQPAHHGVCACNQCVASRVLERLNAPIKPA